MQKHYWFICGLIGCMLLPFSNAVAESIGKTQQANNEAYGTPPDEARRPLKKRDPVFQDELIETGAQSWVWLKFSGRSRLKISANTALLLNEFVFDR